MNADDRLIYLIFTTQNKLRTYLNNAMTADGVKVTVAQSGILFLLKEKNGRSMTELSRILGIDNSTLSGLIDRLEKARLVERNASPTDRRSSHIYMTQEGIEAAEGAKRVIRRVNEKIKDGFTPEEMETFKKVLKTFFGRFA
jgi:MarR family transcriptional regulator, organic hydroperoxide resistance regulator